jgi:hypothetical protein
MDKYYNARMRFAGIRFPLLIHYLGEQYLTIVRKPDELIDGIPFTVIETQIE